MDTPAPPKITRPPYTRYLRFFLGISLSLLAAVALFNLLIDPSNIYRVISWGNSLKYKSSLGTRVAKAEAIRRPDWDIDLIGSSRTDNALDPTIPAWDGARVYNCGLPGTNIEEILQATHLALQNPNLKEIILCTDMEDFDPNRESQDDFSQSLFNPQINPLEYHLAGLLGMAATDQSINSLRGLLRHRIGDHTPEGLLLHATRRLDHDEWITYTASLMGRLGIARLNTDPRHLGAGGIVDPARFADLDQILNLTAARHIRVTLVILPGHVVWLESVHDAGRWSAWEDWNRQLVRRIDLHNQKNPDQPVPIWCFKQYIRFNEEPVPPKGQPSQMVWYHDPVHFAIDLGNLVTDRIRNHYSHKYPNSNDFGVELTPANIDAYLAKTRTDRAAYIAQTPWIREFMRAAQEYTPPQQ